MLDSAKKRAINDPKALTIIGQGTIVHGDIKSKGTIRIEGGVQGRIQSEDSVVIQETGRVKAELRAQQVVISGEVEGNVFAHDRLEITANGRLVGDITAPKVSIAEGVMFEGKCTMKPPAPPRPPQASPGQVAAPPSPGPSSAPQQQTLHPQVPSATPERKGPPTP